jgi:hypothetical protein
MKQRCPLAIKLNGIDNVGIPWSYPLRFCEPANHKALTQLAQIEALFNDINYLNTTSGQFNFFLIIQFSNIFYSWKRKYFQSFDNGFGDSCL